MSSGVLVYVCLDGGMLPQPFYWTQIASMARAYADMNGCHVVGLEIPWDDDDDGLSLGHGRTV